MADSKKKTAAKKTTSAEPKPTKQRVRLPGIKRDCVVYEGPRGGQYVKQGGQFLPLKMVTQRGGCVMDCVMKCARSGGKNCGDSCKSECSS